MSDSWSEWDESEVMDEELSSPLKSFISLLVVSDVFLLVMVMLLYVIVVLESGRRTL